MNSQKTSENELIINGLKHKECLKILYNQINDELINFKNNNIKLNLIIRKFFKQNYIEFIHNFVFIFICSILSFILNKNGSFSQFLNGLILLIISILNAAILFYTFFKRSLAIYNNVKIILKSIQDCIDSNEKWSEKHFASLSLPNTLSILCQWVVREGKLVNLPLNLVVSGDCIVLRPGHIVSINCRSVEKNATTGDYEYFLSGQKYDPSVSTEKKNLNDKYEFLHRAPIKKKIPQAIKCVAQETPYIKFLRSTLANYNPNSDLILENETKALHKIYVFIIIPIVFLLQLFITTCYYLIFNQNTNDKNLELMKNNKKTYIDIILTNLLFSMLPLLPISFTLFWNFIKFYGLLVIFKIFKNFHKIQLQRQNKHQQHLQSSSLADDISALLMQQTDGTAAAPATTTTTAAAAGNNLDSSSDDNSDDLNSFSFISHKLNTDSLKLDYHHSIETLMHLNRLKFNIKGFFTDICSVLKAILFERYNDYFNQNIAFIFSTNFFIGLGSLTNFSCVDKKGVLSWPNPTAENIWLFKNNPTDSNSMQDLHNPDEATNTNNILSTNTTRNKEIIKLETFNLTNDKIDGFRLHFDDSNWLSNINLLKPLGLSILLNTCNKNTVDYYLKFSDLLKIEADNENLRSISKIIEMRSISDRRCLCEISHLMNFEDNALNCYEVVSINSLYRDTVTNTIIKQQSIQKPQIPISNLMSVMAYYKHNGIYNMYCQGTADLVIDFCTDYWDGKEIKSLSYNQRKKLLDVFQRNSVASYCTAFSYKPVIDNDEKYLLDATKRINNYSIKCPIVSNTIYNRNLYDSVESINSTDYHETLSFDGAMNEDLFVDYDYENSDDGELCENLVELHSNQIFIGMVSMQYKAKIEVIKLVEKLTKACIRFMHFSSDNEQISRVFGEALGLDAGWNCHISLANSDSKSSSSYKESNEGATNSNKILPNSSSSNLDKFNKKHVNLSLPNLKTPSLFDTQTQTVKFDLSNIKTKKSDKDENNLSNEHIQENEFSNTIEEYDMSNSNNEQDAIVKNSRCRESITSKISTDLDERKKLFNNNSNNKNKQNKQDDESSSHQTAHSGRTLSDTEILGNAARLPKGVENIRQHIENVDNVPLHVSLFTDCSKNSIKDMFTILRDYGEIVCCFGSSHSIENIELFTEANLAIAIEPLYPQLCMKETVVQDRNKLHSKYSKTYPIDLSSLMNTFNCGLCLKHDNLSLLPHIMSHAREIVYSYYGCIAFMLMCSMSLCVIHLLGSMLYLPPFFSSSELLWLIIFIIPALSFSLINKSKNEDNLRCSTKKNSKEIDKDEIYSFIVKFISKFLPTICVMVFMYCLTLYFKCKIDIDKELNLDQNIGYNSSYPIKCHKFLFDYWKIFYNNSSNYKSYWSDTDSVNFSQILNNFFITFYFIVLSMNYVYIEKSLWHYIPFKNTLWTITIIIVLFIQMIYTTIELYRVERLLSYLNSIPIFLWIIYFPIWPILIIIFNELIKVFEIKTILRKYKKIRLEFDTKLGMNSPFV